MIRLAITIGLFLSLVFLARGMVVTLKTDPLKGVEKVKKEKRSSRPVPIIKPVRFYPPPPPVLPDLGSGYLFNEERALAGKVIEESPGGGQELAVNINDVFYVGSVITDEYRKGIVSYPEIKTPATTGRRQPRQATAAAAKMQQAFLVLGDTLGGYKVTEVEPDRIVFTRGAETVEKLLNDPDKKRKTVAPQPKARATQRTPTRRDTPTRRTIRTPAARQQTRQPATQRSRTTNPAARNKAVPMTREQIREMEQELERAERQKR